MKLSKKKGVAGIILLAALLILSGCSGDAAPEVDEGQEQARDISLYEVIHRSEDEVAAYYHDNHWHGFIPEVEVGSHVSLGAHLEENGEAVELDGDHNGIAVALAEGAEDGIVSFDMHGDHVHIKGEQEGITQVVFQFLHDGEVEFETSSIEVQVLAGEGEAAEETEETEASEEVTEISLFEIINRSEDEVIAYYHDDHWHGSLPVIEKEGHASLGAYLEGNGEEVALDRNHYTLGAALAEGAEDGIVSFDMHGDHVHVKGVEEGTTQVVFQFLHEGEVAFETGSIEVTVE
ncbi:hypothetical protein SAMN05192551_103246 [Tindallia magadiensis]|uniref:Uncharacterized protein n=1 Tax=Tindallia magadiensis TaxID=69895 RepID=A0A1I3DCP7_9FIRM|nr:hypothetical protein [Tindallia magadiensis]SFH84542.1 hypothetical protein SAMN05192551_103246 [Tindallia magadiensis]